MTTPIRISQKRRHLLSQALSDALHDVLDELGYSDTPAPDLWGNEQKVIVDALSTFLVRAEAYIDEVVTVRGRTS